MKKMVAIEKLGINDYLGLKQYLLTDPIIQSNDKLVELSAFLANVCEIELENWQTAIACFENIIQSPESMEDSIFAIIDLEHTYLLMQNGGQKSTYSGNMLQYVPASKQAFDADREFLLSLLPGDQMSEQMQNNLGLLQSGELLQNVPNPFSDTTTLWYRLEKESSVVVKVYDYTGKEISTFAPGQLDQGYHKLEFRSEGLPTGVYFYKLELNGQMTDSKKMTIVR